jgi:hygromycin-B 4-O-kinase
VPPPVIAIDTVKTLLEDRLGFDVASLTLLTPGAWSRAFAFQSDAGPFVIRFSDHPDDFDRDAYAARFRTDALPIPRITQRGTLDDISYAISNRVPGGFLDALDREGFEATLSSLLDAMDGLRRAPLKGSIGYGGWNRSGNGTHVSWQASLRASVQDPASQRGGPWRSQLESSPIGTDAFDRDAPVLLRRIPDMPECRHLIHGDMLNFNVFVDGHAISGLIDWGCAMYGDFLYDLAWFAFWWPWYPTWHGVEIVSAARNHFEERGADLESFRERLFTYQLQIGLTHQAYHATTGDWAMLEAVARRTTEIADEFR